ncbi:MAG: YkgJ family cysteine cluster protein [Verrucomicrobiales bacterium]|nr:YkgJ family cysteine cluster protein [Verrucomicrobiales bacterium]
MPIFYDCQRCTACCRWPGQVRLDEATILSIATYLGLTESAFIQRYTRLRADRRGLALLDQPDGACIFLEDSNCRIQAVKPQQCRDFPNRWNFPGFEKLCHALPRAVDDAEYLRLVTQATGLPPETAA